MPFLHISLGHVVCGELAEGRVETLGIAAVAHCGRAGLSALQSIVNIIGPEQDAEAAVL